MGALLHLGWGGPASRAARYLALGFLWAIVGIIFVLGGVWELYGITVPLLPLLLIAAGVAVIIGVFGGRHLARRTHE